VQESLRAWLRAQPDLAAAGLHERLAGSGVQVWNKARTHEALDQAVTDALNTITADNARA
jgi:hypothetical protein